MTAAPSGRTEVRRLPERGHYDADTVRGIIDEALICHIAFVVDGSPVVIPTFHTRVDDTLYIHGSPASRMLRTLKRGVDMSVAITHLDGIVLARSGFHHSMNYRSVVVFGRATEVTDDAEKEAVLCHFIDHLVPGRTEHIRPNTELERRGTTLLAIELDEASAKIRTGGPVDDDEDYELPIWAGVIGLGVGVGETIADDRNRDDVDAPGHVTNWRLPAARRTT